MSNTLFISLAVLGILGGVLAVVLYFVAQKFKVEENPLIDEAEACLPGANCGGCGFAGCRALAEACVKQAAEKGNIDRRRLRAEGCGSALQRQLPELTLQGAL